VPSPQQPDLPIVLEISELREPVRHGADLAQYCSETEQYCDNDSAWAEIWIFGCLIYHRPNRSTRENAPNWA
jgi:hypothetical protein